MKKAIIASTATAIVSAIANKVVSRSVNPCHMVPTQQVNNNPCHMIASGRKHK